MTRWAFVLLVAFALAAPAGAGGPARMQVLAREYSFTLSRDSVHEGKLLVELANFGEDPHNLIVRKGNKEVASSLLIPSGQRAELEVKLTRGSYVIYCSLEDHEARGMTVLLRVKAKKRHGADSA